MKPFSHLKVLLPSITSLADVGGLCCVDMWRGVNNFTGK
jgi:hypothetical protein